MEENQKTENQATAQPVLNKNTFSWLWEFTKGKRGKYLLSVILALLGVLCMLLAYICLAALIRELVTGGRDLDLYIRRGVQIGILWVLRYAFHGFSTYTSHGATF